jgi:hypothetical protein
VKADGPIIHRLVKAHGHLGCATVMYRSAHKLSVYRDFNFSL